MKVKIDSSPASALYLSYSQSLMNLLSGVILLLYETVAV